MAQVKWQGKKGNGENGNVKYSTGKNGNGRNGTSKNGTGKNATWPDLNKRTALFCNILYTGLLRMLHFLIHRFRICIHRPNCFFHYCSQGIDILIFGADAHRYYSFFYP